MFLSVEAYKLSLQKGLIFNRLAFEKKYNGLREVCPKMVLYTSGSKAVFNKNEC